MCVLPCSVALVQGSTVRACELARPVSLRPGVRPRSDLPSERHQPDSVPDLEVRLATMHGLWSSRRVRAALIETLSRGR